MAAVKFNDLDEFIGELRRDAAEVERKILRVTVRHRTDGQMPIRSMAVVASAVVAGHVVTLQAPCGTYLPGTGEADGVSVAAKERLAALEAAAGELGLEVRAGVFE